MTGHSVPQIFDKGRRARRYARARAHQQAANTACFLYDEMAEDMLERVDFMRLGPGAAVVMGDVTGKLASGLTSREFAVKNVAPGSFDEEQPWPGPAVDYIFSINTLDTLNDLPGAILHIRNALKDGGMLFASFLGAGSLPALRKIMLAADGDRPAARLHPQIDNRAASALLERAGFKRQVVDTHTMRATYRSLDRLIGDLREQGLTSVLRSKSPAIGKSGLARARAAFDALRDDEGRVSETLEILTLTAWR